MLNVLIWQVGQPQAIIKTLEHYPKTIETTTLVNKDQIFKQLFDTDYQKLCHYASRIVNDDVSAEDIVQETFIKIWETKQDILGQEVIHYYLLTAVRNNCISFIRKQKQMVISSIDESQIKDIDFGLIPMVFKEEEEAKSKRLIESLNLLPPKCREVFLLIKMHGLSYRQTAELMNLSIKTIENQMGKAIKMFREQTIAIK